MASVTYGDKVFGLRDIKVTNIGGTTQEDLDAAQMAEFVPELGGDTLPGDDVKKAALAFVIGGQIKFGAGSFSSAALAIMTGSTLATSGTTPNEATTLQLNAGQRMPYFKVYAQAYDDGTGDVHILCSKVKMMSIPAIAKLENGSFRVGEFEAECFDDGSNGVVQIVQNETAAALPST